MRDSRRTNLQIVLALLIIAAAFAAYAALVMRWLSVPARTSASSAPAGRNGTDEKLAAARRDFREHLLEPAAHLRLSEALWKAGRPVDSFYAAHAARELFGEEAFRGAHAAVVLGAGGPAADSIRRLEGLRESAQTVPIFAETARDFPETPEGRDALEALSRMAAGDENAPGGESARMARTALEELHVDDPKHAGKLAALGMALLARGDGALAEATATEALSKFPHHAGAAQILGALALQRKDPESAQRWFAASWDKNPEDLYSAARLAQYYDKRRADPEAALPFYLALFRRDPDYADGGVAVEQRIREILDARRESLLHNAPIEGLGTRFHIDDASLRAEACARAASFKDPRWVPALGELLDDDVEIVRRNADYALYEIGRKEPEAVRSRREEWLKSPKTLVRIRALNLFADLDGKNALPAVIAALRDADPAVRFFAKVMVLDHYYKDVPEASKARVRYLGEEQDQNARLLLARYPGPR